MATSSLTWTRENIGEMFELTGVGGSPIVLEPGRLWIAVFPDNRTVSW